MGATALHCFPLAQQLGNESDGIAQCMQAFNPGHMIHQAEGVTFEIELPAFQSRPRRHAHLRQEALETLVAELAG